MASCVFCDIVAGSVPAFQVIDSPDGVGFLDTRPVFKGHVLIVPRAHVVTLADLPVADLPGYFGLVQRVAAAVPDALGAQGTFVANNNVVSQSVAHLHFHVVPRTKGDGLRGFFWPRTKYADDEEATSYAASIAAKLG
ncbi:HIT family protein [Actinoplanes bogorensis]|uniref:HIT family protein n=1 Tax=Paractinoplanes bogorensis TaxID=1610840 RepID=A0ABS5YZI0_9ACTN|nr:HIT family protein [Actinoplanes bogorensis]MBU2668837.1 HIT family protein [Actinoplanes bogorensis]